MIELDLVQIGFGITYLFLWYISFVFGRAFNEHLGSNEKFIDLYSIIFCFFFLILTVVNKTVPTGVRNEYLKHLNSATSLIDYLMWFAYLFGMLLGILLINQLLTYLILILWKSLKKLHHWINQL